MHEASVRSLEPLRLENGRPLLIAGVNGHYTRQTVDGITAQWRRFGPRIGRIAGQVGRAAYGVVCGRDGVGGFEYLAGVEVSSFSDTPTDLNRIRIPSQRYAVFAHCGHVSTIRNTMHAVWTEWLPRSGREIAEAPYFERYGEGFDPHTGTGDIEIWIPILERSATRIAAEAHRGALRNQSAGVALETRPFPMPETGR